METGYKGKIVFYKYLNGVLASNEIHCARYNDWMHDDPGYLILGECEVDVKFTHDIGKEIEALEKQKQDKLAEMQRLVDYFDGKIRDLQCLPNRVEEESSDLIDDSCPF